MADAHLRRAREASSSPAAPASSARTTSATCSRNTDDEVTVYDALTYAGNLSTLRDVDDDPRYPFVKGNICDPGTLEEAMAGHDAVVHFAAESHVDRSIAGPDDFINTNCFGTNIVMDTARRLEIGRVVHIGTDEVYGSVEVGSSKETDPLEPRSPYSASKAGSDLIALSYHHTYGAAGHRDALHEQLRAVPVSRRRRSRSSPPTCSTASGIPLYGDGLNERDWLYVDDHCAGVHLVLARRARRARSTTSAPATRRRTACSSTSCSRCSARARRSSSTSTTGSVTTAATRSTSPRSPRSAGSKQRTLDEALEETVAWYRDNRWWWEPLKARGA